MTADEKIIDAVARAIYEARFPNHSTRYGEAAWRYLPDPAKRLWRQCARAAIAAAQTAAPPPVLKTNLTPADVAALHEAIKAGPGHLSAAETEDDPPPAGPYEIRCEPDGHYHREGRGDATYVSAPGVEHDAYVRRAADGKFVFSAPYEIGFLEVVVSDGFAAAWRKEFGGRHLSLAERDAASAAHSLNRSSAEGGAS